MKLLQHIHSQLAVPRKPMHYINWSMVTETTLVLWFVCATMGGHKAVSKCNTQASIWQGGFTPIGHEGEALGEAQHASHAAFAVSSGEAPQGGPTSRLRVLVDNGDAGSGGGRPGRLHHFRQVGRTVCQGCQGHRPRWVRTQQQLLCCHWPLLHTC